MARKGKRYYAVAKGKKPGIYTSWPEAEAQVTGFPGAIHKGFKELDQAQQWLSQQATIVHNSNGRYFEDHEGLTEEQLAYNELAEIRQIRARHGREAARNIREQMGIEDASSPEPIRWPTEEPDPQVETAMVGTTSTPLPARSSYQDTLPPDADLYTRRRLRDDDSDDDDDGKTTRRRPAPPQRSRHERHEYRTRRSASPERARRNREP